MKKTRNPNFANESFKQLSWTRVVKNKFPHDHTTSCCEKRTEVGQIVVTVPVFIRGKLVGTGILHYRCLMGFMENVPEDFSLVQEKVAAIKDTFVR